VTAALWTGRPIWPLGALLRATPLDDRSGTMDGDADSPSVRFQEKWRFLLTLLWRCRTARLHLTAVVAGAEYGDNGTSRPALHRARLPCALGIPPTPIVFLGTPTLRVDPRQTPPRNRREGWPDHDAVSLPALSEWPPDVSGAGSTTWSSAPWRTPFSRKAAARAGRRGADLPGAPGDRAGRFHRAALCQPPTQSHVVANRSKQGPQLRTLTKSN
jgi:hypothetical protein